LDKTTISQDEYERVLTRMEEKDRSNPKKRWVNRMMRSAKQYYKLCPYYDKKTGECFIKKTDPHFTNTRCDRDGRFDSCSVFEGFLEKKYEEYVSKGRPLPVDFFEVVTGFI